MKLQRTLTGWAECSPKAMAHMSPAAIQYALEDARADILTLAALLCTAGYPRRGTDEETQTMMDFARKVQALIPHEEAVSLPRSHEGRLAEMRAASVSLAARRETEFAQLDEAIATHRAASL
jgi:hypothetical protein